MWAHNQPVLFSCFKSPLLSQSQSSIPKNKEPSPWSVWTIPVPHTSSIPFESFRPTCAVVSGSCLPETDQSADSEWCLQKHIGLKPLCVIEAGGAQKQECDHVIKATIEREKPLKIEIFEISHIVYFLTGSLHTWDFTGCFLALLCKFTLCKIDSSRLNCWHFVGTNKILRLFIVSSLM